MRLLLIFLITSCGVTALAQQPVIIAYPSKQSRQPLDGRLLLLLAKNNKTEPRFQVSDGSNTQLVFGMDVEDWKAGQSKTFTGKEFGYPLQSIKEVPPGDYYVQVLLHKYETFNRKDGHTVKLPMDRGEGQQWNQAP